MIENHYRIWYNKIRKGQGKVQKTRKGKTMKENKISKIKRFYIWNIKANQFMSQYYKIYYKCKRERTIVSWNELPKTAKNFIIEHFFEIEQETEWTRITVWREERKV